LTCYRISSSGGGQNSDWDDPMGDWEIFSNEDFGGIEVTVPTNASMANITPEELIRIFTVGLPLSTGCTDFSLHDVVYTQGADGPDNMDYNFGMTICRVGPDECLKQIGWRGFIDIQSNGEIITETFEKSGKLSKVLNGQGDIVFTTICDSQGNQIIDPNIIECSDTLQGVQVVTLSGADTLFSKINPVCWSSIVIGLDNTQFGCFGDGEITLLNADGSTTVINPSSLTQTGVAACSPQLNDWAALFGAAYPNLLVEPRCNPNSCGGLNGTDSDVTFNLMKVRYLYFKACPTDLHYPIGATITDHINPKKIGLPMDLEFVPSPEKRGYECINKITGEIELRENINGNLQPVPEADLPVCVYDCSKELKEPEPICEIESILGFDCYDNPLFDPENEDNTEGPFLTSPIIINISNCDGEQFIGYYQEIDGSIVDYNEGNGLLGQWTNENCEAQTASCPEGLDFQCYQTDGGFFEIWDNSNYTLTDGSTLNHLQNGNSYEITLHRQDGTTVVVQQTADPYFNNLKGIVEAAMPGCQMRSVCANHTSPKGCNAGFTKTLAEYDVYDSPTFPVDIQNNISNPAQSELWATGWMLDCDCGSPVTRVELTNATNPAHIGAYKDLIFYEKEPEIIQKAIDCNITYYKDCFDNDIPPVEGCKLTPCSAAGIELPTLKCEVGEEVWSSDKWSIWIGTPANDPTVTHCVVIDGVQNCATIINDGNKPSMVAALTSAFAPLDVNVIDTNPDGGSQIEIEVTVPCHTDNVVYTIQGVASIQQEKDGIAIDDMCEDKDAVHVKLCEEDLNSIVDALSDDSVFSLAGDVCFTDGKTTIKLKSFCAEGQPTKYQDDTGADVDISGFEKTDCSNLKTCTTSVQKLCDVAGETPVEYYEQVIVCIEKGVSSTELVGTFDDNPLTNPDAQSYTVGQKGACGIIIATVECWEDECGTKFSSETYSDNGDLTVVYYDNTGTAAYPAGELNKCLEPDVCFEFQTEDGSPCDPENNAQATRDYMICYGIGSDLFSIIIDGVDVINPNVLAGGDATAQIQAGLNGGTVTRTTTSTQVCYEITGTNSLIGSVSGGTCSGKRCALWRFVVTPTATTEPAACNEVEVECRECKQTIPTCIDGESYLIQIYDNGDIEEVPYTGEANLCDGGGIEEGRILALEEKINRECVQLWAEDSGNIDPGVYNYSFGNGNELSDAAYDNWGVMALYNGEIVEYGITIDDPVNSVQTVAITLDGTQVQSITVPTGGDEALLTGLSIPVTQGQVINWQTVTGNADDVVPTAIVCYEIE